MRRSGTLRTNACGVETTLAVETPVSGGLSDTSDTVVEAGSPAHPRPQQVRQREQGGVVHFAFHLPSGLATTLSPHWNRLVDAAMSG